VIVNICLHARRLRAQEVAVRDARQEAELLQSKLARQGAAREAEVQ